MALVNCPHCGKVLSDKATQCPHCGESVESSADNFGTLTFKWKGAWVLLDAKIHITLNGENAGDSEYYSFKKGFEFDVPIKSDKAEIKIKHGSGLTSRTNTLDCKFEKGMNYTCILSYDKVTGGFLSKVTNEDGDVVFKEEPKGWKKLFS